MNKISPTDYVVGVVIIGGAIDALWTTTEEIDGKYYSYPTSFPDLRSAAHAINDAYDDIQDSIRCGELDSLEHNFVPLQLKEVEEDILIEQWGTTDFLMEEQEDKPQAPPFSPKFDGSDVTSADSPRLIKQIRHVFDVVKDGKARSVPEIAKLTAAYNNGIPHPENSVSAQLRNLRKIRNGGFTLEKERVSEGYYTYKLVDADKYPELFNPQPK